MPRISVQFALKVLLHCCATPARPATPRGCSNSYPMLTSVYLSTPNPTGDFEPSTPASNMGLFLLFFFFFWRSPQLAVELKHCAGWRSFTPHNGNDRITQCFGKALMRQLHSNLTAVSGSAHTGKQIDSFDAVIHMQENPPQEWFLVGCSSPYLRFVERLSALRACC